MKAHDFRAGGEKQQDYIKILDDWARRGLSQHTLRRRGAKRKWESGLMRCESVSRSGFDCPGAGRGTKTADVRVREPKASRRWKPKKGGGGRAKAVVQIVLLRIESMGDCEVMIPTHSIYGVPC